MSELMRAKVDVYFTDSGDAMGTQVMVIGHFDSTEEAERWIETHKGDRYLGAPITWMLCNWVGKDEWQPWSGPERPKAWSDLHDCLCVWSKPGPQHWDWRCLRCSGVVRPFFVRRHLRKQAR